ncbi:hypothetical protein [Mesorhizobium sp. KR2-14]|uniref:hypothetical protein n=1 Tax=Mesorhizobium sp. KR2-14 TaxID=3156610 RepID=UPI0032B36886
MLRIQPRAIGGGFFRAERSRFVKSLCKRALCRLAIGVQIAALKESDLIVSEGGEGKLYALRIPRAKQRGGGIRASLKIRYCSKQIGQLLEKVIDQNRRRRERLGYDDADWPMFMSTVEGELPGLRYHIPSNAIARMVNDVIGSITGLKTNTKRFRITLAQRAVDDGKDKYTVAELLDHSDTQNVGVYYAASPSMVLRLDRHLAMEMAPLAQAFSGVIVKTEVDARRGMTDPAAFTTVQL